MLLAQSKNPHIFGLPQWASEERKSFGDKKVTVRTQWTAF
jgi:hypothetical protein